MNNHRSSILSATAVTAIAATLFACSGAPTGSVANEGARPTRGALSGTACSGGGGGGPTGGPADMFPCDSYWFKDVSALPAASDQSAVASIGTWGRGRMRVDFSITYMHADGSAPVPVQLDPGYDPDNDHVDVPVPRVGAVEDEAGYECTQGGDCHLIVVDDATQRLFELWQASNANGQWTASQETVWDLSKTCGSRGAGCTSADAAGFPILPGLIGVRETAAGEINHAIRFILPQDRILHNGYVAPASHSTASYSGRVPMGARLRLKASFDETTLPSAGAQTVARALKRYGMLLADAGNDALTAQSDRFETQKWDGVLGPEDLAAIQPSDFELVDMGDVQTPTSMDCRR